jgi:hypothetical protein
MKTTRFIRHITAVLGLAAFSTACRSETPQTAGAPSPPAKDPATATATTTVPGPAATVPVATAPSPDIASARWSEIKDCTYDMRAQFFAGLNRLEARVDAEVAVLTAQRAAMKSTANTKAWDFAMKEMGDARSYLKSMGEELSKASPETWSQEKDKVGQAWVRTQAAFDNVKSSTTG